MLGDIHWDPVQSLVLTVTATRYNICTRNKDVKTVPQKKLVDFESCITRLLGLLPMWGHESTSHPKLGLGTASFIRVAPGSLCSSPRSLRNAPSGLPGDTPNGSSQCQNQILDQVLMYVRWEGSIHQECYKICGCL